MTQQRDVCLCRIWPLRWLCHGHCCPWGVMWPWAGMVSPRPGSPILHKDDVVESTTSRPLHTVGTYCDAEPDQEGRGQG